MKGILFILGGALVVMLGGCRESDGLTRVIVSGSVTYRGEPVQDGQIRFVPQDGTRGPSTIAPITDGQYRCKRFGGVPVGVHRVEILAFDPHDKSLGMPGAPPRRQLTPPKYNRESTLSVTIASESGAVVQDFSLTE